MGHSPPNAALMHKRHSDASLARSSALLHFFIYEKYYSSFQIAFSGDEEMVMRLVKIAVDQPATADRLSPFEIDAVADLNIPGMASLEAARDGGEINVLSCASL